MEVPYITIVHNQEYGNRYCKLLVMYNEHKFYYSEDKSHRELIHFKEPYLIETIDDKLILHSKNNKHILTIKI